MPALMRTAQGLERIRALLGHPIHVNSGYRSPEVNAAVGSKPTSQHMKGEAADIIVRQHYEALKWIAGNLPFDQLIDEFPPRGWIHVSYSPAHRRQMLVIDSRGARPIDFSRT